jgi:hypothetical protein
MKKQTKKQTKKHTTTARQRRRTASRYDVPGEPISREELLSRSGLSDYELTTALKHHLLPGAVQVDGSGGEGATNRYEWRTGHLPYCELVAKVRAADGSYALAALRLLVEGLPFTPESAPWLRKALRLYMVRQFGEQPTLSRVRRYLNNTRLTPQAAALRAVSESERMNSASMKRRDTTVPHRMYGKVRSERGTFARRGRACGTASRSPKTRGCLTSRSLGT